ncbi:hypothetical protein PR1_3 [Providencia phage vB_PreS_PR1]|uniref:Uncharacterized protein n=1 Tax=Providencia phage vB_PreS_PR1 TaxID=1931407 RepID=A0A1S6KV29_9CAUD|nr:hypothetical protein FDH30_gp003 [Providencia phage vB_PreS_PR1]AQT25268.1 hypothetical protein PR1_3 [Providencia phage vB_PreS_PR1]
MKMITVYSNGKTFDNGAIENVNIVDGSIIRYGKGLINNDQEAASVATAIESALPRIFGDIAEGVTGGLPTQHIENVAKSLEDYYSFIDIDTSKVDVTEVIVLMTESDFLFSDLADFVEAGWQVLVSPINARSESPYKIKVTFINPVQPALFTEE